MFHRKGNKVQKKFLKTLHVSVPSAVNKLFGYLETVLNFSKKFFSS